MKNEKNNSGKSSSRAKIVYVGDPDDKFDEPKKFQFNRKLALVVLAVIIVLAMAFFTIGSFAGILQTFLTPDSRINKPAETTTEAETSSTEEESTTAEETTSTTEEESTIDYTPSYYVIDVNLAYNQVVVYTRGEKLNDGYDPKDPRDDQYDLTPTLAFACSPGVDGATPTGRYELGDRSDWCFMVGDVYTQYATRITDAIMFHSVPYYTKDPGDLETYEYNILGYDASSGCIRLNCRDASWIFYNCAVGTEVNIFYDYYNASPIELEPTYKIPTDLDPLSKWDPTDTTFGNPWHSYTAHLTANVVSVPQGSSIDYLLACLGPTDEYGSNLSNDFYTSGGYDLWTPGTYYTTGYIDVAGMKFSFPITIIVTEEYSDDYYSNYNNMFGSDDYDDDYGYYSDDEIDYNYYSDHDGNYGYDAAGADGEQYWYDGEDWY